MILLLIVVGYLLGSIPVAWIITRLHHGNDLRQLGSGNVGVMNTALSVHRWAGLVVFLSEITKGAASVVVARMIDPSALAVGLTVLATIVGTRWSIWLGFTGGRGNTAALAALTLISWQTLLAIGAIYFLARLLTHSSFLAMRVSLLLLPLTFGLITGSWWAVLFGASFSLIFLSTHRPESDDHLQLKERWPTFWAFLTSPPRK